MTCNSVHKSNIGQRVYWLRCTEPYNHEGKHFDYKRDFSWEGPCFYHGDWDEGESVKVQKERVKKWIAANGEEIDRNNRAVEKVYETRTGQLTIHGKKRMDADWEKDMAEIDAFFLNLYKDLYEGSEYFGEF